MTEQFNEMGRLWTRAELATEASISVEAMRKRQFKGLHGLELIARVATKEEKQPKPKKVTLEERWIEFEQLNGGLTEEQQGYRDRGLSMIGAKPD